MWYGAKNNMVLEKSKNQEEMIFVLVGAVKSSKNAAAEKAYMIKALSIEKQYEVKTF